MIIYASIGNSDDKLTQLNWADFVRGVDSAIGHRLAARDHMHGRWFSAPDVQWQSACWRFEAAEDVAARIKSELEQLAYAFRQDSIAWAVADTEFLAPRLPDGWPR